MKKMLKIIVKILAAIAALVTFLNILTSTWVNLVTLHVIPAIHFGTFNVTGLVFFGVSTIFAMLISVGAFFLGGFYWFAVLFSLIAKLIDPSSKISPWRMTWGITWGVLVEMVFHRESSTSNNGTNKFDDESIKKLAEEYWQKRIEKQTLPGQGGARAVFSLGDSSSQANSSIPEKKQDKTT